MKYIDDNEWSYALSMLLYVSFLQFYCLLSLCRYMAYYLRMKDPEKARGVADRGVRRISTKEDQERLNLWIAFLNFEAEFGTSQTLENTIKRALLYNDPKKVLMQLTYLHQKRREFELCIEACRTCVRKYPESKKVGCCDIHVMRYDTSTYI